jgi:hypothetical protein
VKDRNIQFSSYLPISITPIRGKWAVAIILANEAYSYVAVIAGAHPSFVCGVGLFSSHIHFLLLVGVLFLILIYNYFWFDTSVIPYADARCNTFRAVHLSVLLAFPYLSDYQAPQRLLLRTPPPRMKLAREALEYCALIVRAVPSSYGLKGI